MCNIVESRLDIFLCYIEIRSEACNERNMNCIYKYILVCICFELSVKHEKKGTSIKRFARGNEQSKSLITLMCLTRPESS